MAILVISSLAVTSQFTSGVTSDYILSVGAAIAIALLGDTLLKLIAMFGLLITFVIAAGWTFTLQRLGFEQHI